MKSQLRSALTVFVLLTVLAGFVYPITVTLIAQAAFPHQANGSLLTRDGKTVGSELIGQYFDEPRFFWSRPSATSPIKYDASASSGSNLAPTNPDFLKDLRERVKIIRAAHPDRSEPVPADLVTASASGLDPHISPAAAEYQVTRVARSRGLSDEAVRKLVADHTEARTFGALGEPRVHVLKLNLALEAATSQR